MTIFQNLREFIEHLDRTYHPRFGRKPASFVTTACEGARVIE